VSDALGALRLKVGQDLKAGGVRLAAAVGGGFPDVRVGRGCQALGGHASSVHQPRESGPGGAGGESRRGDAKAYDMVLNGSEIGGGSVRIHNQELQSVVFDLLGHFAGRGAAQVRLLAGRAQVRRAAAWRHRVRSDRLAMLMAGADSIRDVIAFPKTQTAADPADGCAHGSERGAAARTAHSRARSAEGRVEPRSRRFGARNRC
jgi:aspartyl-tRNA synthetase